MNDFSLKLESKKLNRAIAQHLREVRMNKDLPMRVLADQLDAPHSYIGKIELQNRRVDVGEFIHYCRAMKCDPAKELEKILNSEIAINAKTRCLNIGFL